MFIFLEAFSDPFVAAVEAASQSSPGTRAKLHKVEVAEEGLLIGESTEYAASQADQPTPVPTTHPSIPPLATRAMLRFPPKIIFLEINRVNNIITRKRRRCAGPRLLDRSPQPLRRCRSRSPSENGRSWEKLFLCNDVASASPTPLGKPSRRGATLHQQNLTPPPSIVGEQTLDL
jgi:hypothetical protein